MVASIGRVASAAAGTKYFENDGYYADGDPAHHLASSWHGKGAEELGLKEHVSSDSFKTILEGYVIGTSTRLGRMRNGEHEHKPGTDITFSAPKSVSLAAFLGNDQRITKAHDNAVKATLSHIEKNILESRAVNPATGNLERVGNQSMVSAIFRHEASRNLDPQLHSHAVIANMSKGEDGKWRAIENRSLYDNKMLIGAFYRNELASQLIGLGYSIAKIHADGRFEIKGLYTKETLEAFSTRSQEIKAAVKNMGYETSTPAIAARAALLTRSRKAEPDREALKEIWGKQMVELGISPHQAPSLSQEVSSDQASGKTTSSARTAVEWSARHLEERNSTFAQRDLLTSALAFSPGTIEVSAINDAIVDMTKEGRLVEAQTPRGAGYTTDTTLKAERESIDRMESGKDVSKSLVNSEVIGRHLSETTLTDGQKEAVETILASNDRVVGVQGYAGSGKTTMLNTMREIVEANKDISILGFAPSASAANTLEAESGINSNTLQSFLAKYSAISEGRAGKEMIKSMQEDVKGSIIIVDEASLTSSRQMRDLLRITDALQPSRVALIGDTKQLDAVDAGKPFQQLQHAGMEIAAMDQIMRQSNPQLKAAVIEALSGEPTKALGFLGEDNIVETPQDSLAETAARQWLALSPEAREQTSLIAPTHSLREEINGTIRTDLAQDGIINGEAVEIDRLTSVRMTGAECELAANYQEGQIVLFERDIRGANIEKGETLTVLGNDGHQVFFAREDGEKVAIDPAGGVAAMLEVYDQSAMELRAGDIIRWTRNDKTHDLTNTHQAEVIEIKNDQVYLRGEDGRDLTLPANDPALQHSDYAFNATVHAFQGRTTDKIIAVLDSTHQELTNQKTFYVEISRARENAILITDDRENLAATLEMNTGDQISALEGVHQEPTKGSAIDERLADVIDEERQDNDLSLAEFEALHQGVPMGDEHDYAFADNEYTTDYNVENDKDSYSRSEREEREMEV